LPVVILRAIPVPGVDGSFHAARAMAEVAGVTFVTVEDGDPDTHMIRQCFITLQPVVDMVNALA